MSGLKDGYGLVCLGRLLRWPFCGAGLPMKKGWKMTATISRLVAPQQPTWASCLSVRLHGHDVTAFVSVLKDEVRRRASCGLGALQDSALLRELFTLPDGVPVPAATLSEWGRQVLARAPEGVAELGNGTIVRRACSPIRVEQIVVRARDWRTGINRASEFGPFCSRVLILSSLPTGREFDLLELEARLYGIGLIGPDSAAGEWVVPPEPFRPWRLSSGHWLFEERVFAAMLSADIKLLP